MDYTFGYDIPKPESWTPQLSCAPRRPLKDFNIHRKTFHGALGHRLWEWQRLYAMEPSNSSWFWSYYSNTDNLTNMSVSNR